MREMNLVYFTIFFCGFGSGYEIFRDKNTQVEVIKREKSIKNGSLSLFFIWLERMAVENKILYK